MTPRNGGRHDAGGRRAHDAGPCRGGACALPPHGSGFDTLLSELNPLQYLPVVGTIYRAVTGDTIPDTARDVGSLVVSGLTGGPIGLVMALAGLAVEKATGLDPERIGRHVLADLGLETAPPATPSILVASDARPVAATTAGWSPAALKALGVATATDGTLSRAGLTGSDVLNDLELARLHPDAVAAGDIPAASRGVTA